MAELDTVAVVMARTLRGLGVATPPDATVAYAAALAEVGVARRSSGLLGGAGHAGPPSRGHRRLRPGLRRCLRGPAWARSTRTRRRQSWTSVTVLVDTDEDPAPAPDGDGVDGATLTLRWSDKEVLRTKDFARCTVAELDEAHRLMADLRLVGARRPSRRYRPTRRRRGPLDLGPPRARALHTGGEPMRHRPPAGRASGRAGSCSCATCPARWRPTPRALVRFAHVAVAGRAQVEVFTLGTRCTRITRELRSHDPDAALDAVAGVVDDWSGGTRLGEGLRTFNDTWGLRGLARGAVVVILSDGWDRGDPDAARRAGPAAAPRRPPARVGQPAQGPARLRAGGPWHGGRPAPRRRAGRRPLPRVARGARRGDRVDEGPLRRPRTVAAAGQAGRARPGRRPRGLRSARSRRRHGRQRRRRGDRLGLRRLRRGRRRHRSARRARHRRQAAGVVRLQRRRRLRRRAHLRWHRAPLHRAARRGWPTSRDAVRDHQPAVLVTVVDGPGAGDKLLLVEGQEPAGHLADPDLHRVVLRDAEAALAAASTSVRRYGACGEANEDTVTVFFEAFAPPPRLLIFGAVDFTAALVRVAKVLGFHVTVCDAREVFATQGPLPAGRRGRRRLAAPPPRGGGRLARAARRRVRAHPRRQVRRPRHRGGARHRGRVPRRHGVAAHHRAARRTAAGRGRHRRAARPGCWPRSASTSAPARPRRRRWRSAPRSSPSAPDARRPA